MPIDAERGLVFIHVPKTGGTTVERWLDLRRPDQLRSSRPLPALNPPDKVPQHFTPRELRRNVSPRLLASFFKFAFVRNPWDRFLSEFIWRRRGERGP
jgi:hypothetical protein